MGAQGRNQRCRCGSGRNVKFCCGVARGPSDTQMARVFLEEALPPVLASVDTPLERARLARAVIELRHAGRISAPVAAAALLDLGSPDRHTLVTTGLVRAAMVAVGASRTAGGLVVAG